MHSGIGSRPSLPLPNLSADFLCTGGTKQFGQVTIYVIASSVTDSAVILLCLCRQQSLLQREENRSRLRRPDAK